MSRFCSLPLPHFLILPYLLLSPPVPLRLIFRLSASVSLSTRPADLFTYSYTASQMFLSLCPPFLHLLSVFVCVCSVYFVCSCLCSSVCFCLRLYIFDCVSLYLSVCLHTLCQSICLSVYLYQPVPTCVCIHVGLCL